MAKILWCNFSLTAEWIQVSASAIRASSLTSLLRADLASPPRLPCNPSMVSQQIAATTGHILCLAQKDTDSGINKIQILEKLSLSEEIKWMHLKLHLTLQGKNSAFRQCQR